MIVPVAIKSALVRPKRINKIETFFLHRLKGNLKSGQRVQGRSCREQVRDGSRGASQEPALRMGPGQKPLPGIWLDGHLEIAKRGNHSGGCVRGTGMRLMRTAAA